MGTERRDVSNYFDIQGQSWDTSDRTFHGGVLPAIVVGSSLRMFKGNVMSEDQNSGGSVEAPARSRRVTALAGRALSIVATGVRAEFNHPEQSWIDDLVASVRAFPEDARKAFFDRASSAGLPPSVLIDQYIPAAARVLGADWCEDNLSFADVTIGAARLQAMVRDLDRMIDHPEPHASVVMIVLKDAYHTLGAMVATSQLRRAGVAVRLVLGQDVAEASALFKNLSFDAVMVSASATERLDSLRELVKHVRTSGNGSVPVVIGGTILDNNDDVKTLTGADYTLNDPIAAAKKCGLMNLSADVGPPLRSRSR